ncbi:hypothetical protein [Mucisphaera calidilacus]|uniref:PEP-CTERM protein-sorting domain-containing protein n=1 Tax=Mucisphaera calidilacus TaxID=2527982 RepID=A0A518BY10_9BACT|nr:hypothetical protein [Mucisphaera calidilacus]QDU71861.1 hypothetical protein Pan265_17170 [Mucisphaera calidilacus]
MSNGTGFAAGLLAALLMVTSAGAAIFIEAKEYVLEPATADQVIPLYVYGGEAVIGVTLALEIEALIQSGGSGGGGSGGGGGRPGRPAPPATADLLGGAGDLLPVMTDIDLLTGTIFDGNHFGMQFGAAPPSYAVSVGTITQSGTVLTGGTTSEERALLASVTISTEGVESGTYRLKFQYTVHGSTVFAGLNGAGTAVYPGGGEMLTLIVPEPASVSLMVLGLLAVARRW